MNLLFGKNAFTFILGGRQMNLNHKILILKELERFLGRTIVIRYLKCFFNIITLLNSYLFKIIFKCLHNFQNILRVTKQILFILCMLRLINKLY